jgi:hypothetical protein
MQRAMWEVVAPPLALALMPLAQHPPLQQGPQPGLILQGPVLGPLMAQVVSLASPRREVLPSETKVAHVRP